LALQPGRHTADDGGAGTRGAGNHGHALRAANGQRLLPAHIANLGGFGGGLGLAFDPENDEPADDQRNGHHGRLEQHGLDLLDEQGADHGGGQKGQHDVAGKTPGLRIPLEQPLDDLEDALAENPDDGKNGAKLDDHFKDLGVAGIELNPIPDQDQVSGARDG